MIQFPQLAEKNENALTATIKTNKGDITVRLFPEHAPKTVENFIGLAEKGYYDGVIFHRVIPNFMIQGGDPTGSGMGGESLWGGNFEDEFSPELFNLKGALSMANAGPATNSSQFFIVTMSELPEQMIPQLEQAGFPEEIINAYKQNGGTPWLDQKHTVFGQVVNGYEVAETIENVERNAMDKPNEDVVIETIEVHN
ncbi:peptidylprolyl isomerase [Marinilactibacillus psychrotolerans]|uniref:Peptidyl-prolyl cis-trans isomerase n=1 Tax=Marinilactibacillus psychrotolerans TaxID=191770 RepID=A0AAV3WVF8_9LACT|nr:peptidylprolyl isomerase [Marinilactibacillus psychrotolerans]GEL68175.1 peptidyl-prolyl cis-trans isomerase [Marinilactibacillus psychrotolerans]GEQ36855.1 peptidyl-prolyl cis-trans isomerase [Marinilactibacillus psychrotolerans]SDD45936.1 peptidyl-prolyl cis-trans isomerase B (cyclophilin B) [Marinilactibacillus psychrotolerans]